MHQYDQSVIERAVKENPCLLDVVKTKVKAIDCNINKRVHRHLVFRIFSRPGGDKSGSYVHRDSGGERPGNRTDPEWAARLALDPLLDARYAEYCYNREARARGRFSRPSKR